MQSPQLETPAVRRTVLELRVTNHPGVMSHICGMFARRAFNLEGILCAPIGDATHSRMLLLVNEDMRLEQLQKELRKLYDVQEVTLRHDVKEDTFLEAARTSSP